MKAQNTNGQSQGTGKPNVTVPLMHLNEHEKSEWLRMAGAIRDKSPSLASALTMAAIKDGPITLYVFDWLAAEYRDWLIGYNGPDASLGVRLYPLNS